MQKQLSLARVPFFLLFLLSFVENSICQSVESAGGLKIGLLGFWVNEEIRLGESFSLNNEVGFDGALFKGTEKNSIDYLFAANISTEPRYYFNLESRKLKNKKTRFNCGTYLSSEIAYISELELKNTDARSVQETLLVIPKIGWRGAIWEKTIFEFAVGYVAFDQHNARASSLALDFRIHKILF